MARGLVFLLAALLVPAWPAVARSEPQPHQQIQLLREGLAAQQDQAAAARQRQEELAGQLAVLERELSARQRQQADLRKRLWQQRQELEQREAELHQARRAQEAAGLQLQRRLIANYQAGSTGLANILFSAVSLPELLEFQENLGRLIHHDRQLMAHHRRLIGDLETARQTLERQQEALETTIALLRLSQEELDQARARHAILLRRAENQRQLYLRAQQELERAIEALENR